MTDRKGLKLRVFDGPFDLLLELIQRKKVDLKRVSLLELASDYLAYLEKMSELDLEIASEFILVAATLLDIKASSLIPHLEVEQPEIPFPQTSDELACRLKQYMLFKEAALKLMKLKNDFGPCYLREALPESRFISQIPIQIGPSNLEEFHNIARNLLSKQEIALETLHSVPSNYRVEEKISWLREKMRFKKTLSFLKLIREIANKSEAIATFLAMLDLIKNGEVVAYQPYSFGDILIEKEEAKEEKIEGQ